MAVIKMMYIFHLCFLIIMEHKVIFNDTIDDKKFPIR